MLQSVGANKFAMEITEGHIEYIEEALNIKLYEHQVDSLLDRGSLVKGRAIGKTMTHIIKLVLSEGKPLIINRPWEFSDYGDGTMLYASSVYRNEFLRIRKILKDYGFSVREIKNG